MVQGGSTIIKYLLFFFNLVFVITGLALIIVGAIVEVRARQYINFIDNASVSTAVFIIILGVIIFGVAFFGCCGAVKENHCMILTFSILLFILFIMELSAGIAAYHFRGKLDDIVHEGLENAFDTWKDNNDTKGFNGWNDIQDFFHCCGVNGVGDFNETSPNASLPFPSCCARLDEHGDCYVSEAYPDGCAKVFIDDFKANVAKIGGAGIGVAIVEVLGIVFACCLARAIKKEYEVV